MQRAILPTILVSPGLEGNFLAASQKLPPSRPGQLSVFLSTASTAFPVLFLLASFPPPSSLPFSTPPLPPPSLPTSYPPPSLSVSHLHSLPPSPHSFPSFLHPLALPMCSLLPPPPFIPFLPVPSLLPHLLPPPPPCFSLPASPSSQPAPSSSLSFLSLFLC